MNLKPLSIKFLIDFGKQYGIDPAILFAIGKKESNLTHTKDGQIIHRFEPHIYNGFIKVKEGKLKFHPALPALDEHWINKHSEAEIKKLSTSYGVYQIMGWHYPMFNYKTVSEMIDRWEIEEIHIQDFCRFCLLYRQGKFLEALRKLDFDKIALMYNGAGYKNNNYDTDLESYFKEYKERIKILEAK